MVLKKGADTRYFLPSIIYTSTLFHQVWSKSTEKNMEIKEKVERNKDCTISNAGMT